MRNTGMFFLFHELGPPWPKLDPLPPLDPPFGMLFLLLFAQPCCLDLVQHPYPFSKPISTLGGLCTGSATEWSLL